MIPRVKFRSVMGGRDMLPSRDSTILAEHAAIAEAIFANDPERAREAMRAHLTVGIQRYRAMTRSEEHTSELKSLMRISYAVFCLNKKQNHKLTQTRKLY